MGSRRKLSDSEEAVLNLAGVEGARTWESDSEHATVRPATISKLRDGK